MNAGRSVLIVLKVSDSLEWLSCAVSRSTMAILVADWNAAAEIWGDRMWAVLWQSTVIAAVVGVMSVLFLRRSSPAVRYWLWQIVAIKLLVMPFWTYAIPLLQVDAAAPDLGEVGLSGPGELADLEPPIQSVRPPASVPSVAIVTKSADPHDLPQATSPIIPITWLGWLLALWVTVIAAQWVRILRQHRRLSRLLRHATPATESLAALMRDAANRLGLKRPPQTVLTDVDCSPFVCGIRQAVLVLPRALTASLSESELSVVLLHELAHLRRHDLVWGWIGELARVVYFFHPVVHWVAYRLRLERELACDKIAMSFSGQDAGHYAATLVRVVSHSSEPSVFKTAAASASLDGKTL
jgi:beta-lactamase regulating signal transducer with metallopeptidase domain